VVLLLCVQRWEAGVASTLAAVFSEAVGQGDPVAAAQTHWMQLTATLQPASAHTTGADTQRCQWNQVCDDCWIMFSTPLLTGEYQQLFVNTHREGPATNCGIWSSASSSGCITAVQPQPHHAAEVGVGLEGLCVQLSH
jgi:hypothetical protein